MNKAVLLETLDALEILCQEMGEQDRKLLNQDSLDKGLLACENLRAAINDLSSAAPVAPAVPEGEKLDASRYRWLRRGPEASGGEIYIGVNSDKFMNRWALKDREADAAVDEAMQATGATP